MTAGKVHKGHKVKEKKGSIILNWNNRKGILAYPFFIYYLFVVYTYTRYSKSEELFSQVAGISLIWVALTFVYLTEMKKVREFFSRHGTWFRGIMLLLQPVFAFLMIEVMVSNYNEEMFQKFWLYNVAWYYVIVFLFFAVIRNSGLTMILSNFTIYLLGMVNYLVYLFRGNPIIPSDLLAWQTGMSVASNYQVSFTSGFLLATLIMYTIFVLVSKFGKGQMRLSPMNRLTGITVYIIFASIVFVLFFHTDLIPSKIRVIDFFAPKYTYGTYGTAFGFMANVEAMETQEPQGYSIDVVEELLSKSEEGSAITGKAEDKPNIIAIMNEAFSDLSMLGDYKTNMSYFPYINTLNENTTKGTMYVSVFGGATSNTEYEFLTGNSMAVMPQNSVPYQQFITDTTDSLAATLKAQGYYNVAIHPYEPSGYKRDLVYPLLGFDEFLSEEDFVNPQLIRSFISDRESYLKIIEKYEAKGDQPLFVFNVTMQNHGGYSGGRVFEESDTVRFTELSGYARVEQYLSLIRESDRAFETLVDYFSQEEEPTILLMFGDHQPVVYSEFLDQIEKDARNGFEINQQKYMVPFILWANYDISEDDVDNISANYLSSYLLKTAGLSGTTYNNYLMELQKEIPVINAHFYLTKEGKYYPLSAESSFSELVQQYKYVGYNNALDKKNKLWEYYRLPQ